VFGQLLAASSSATQPSGSACTKLCGFAQQSAKSTSVVLRAWAFRDVTATQLFDFYLEWNEQAQHRSMNLVLDVLVFLITQNPRQTTRENLKHSLLEAAIAIITRQSTRPLVKSSIISVEHLLSKKVCNIKDVEATIIAQSPATFPPATTWTRFANVLFSWMSVSHVCPAAGKLLVALLKYLREQYGATSDEDDWFDMNLWLQWLRENIAANPGILQNVKNHIFLPLIRTDRHGSIELLGSLNDLQRDSAGAVATLQLAALDVGKKAGLVDEPGAYPGPFFDSFELTTSDRSNTNRKSECGHGAYRRDA
jgi:hypothetical protein